MSEHERFVKWLESTEIPRDAVVWAWRKRIRNPLEFFASGEEYSMACLRV